MKCIKWLFYCLLIVTSTALWAQKRVEVEILNPLDKDLGECSGMALVPSGHLAMINDSGNHPDIYFTDQKGQVVSKTCLMEIQNVDWEEITYSDGFLYIGDFGNNRNKRRDLVIYKYGINSADSVWHVGEIRFSYLDQLAFPPATSMHNYDLEAMVALGDSLFLFTKNRTIPFSGYTYQYGLPNRPGEYILSRQDSFKTGIGNWDEFWISGATLNEDKSKLALLSYDKFWVFSNFSGSNFLSGDLDSFAFDFLSQKEAMAFIDSNSLLISDELNFFGGGQLYSVSLTSPQKLSQSITDTSFSVTLYAKDFTDSISVGFSKLLNSKVLWEIYNTKGQRVKTGSKEDVAGLDALHINSIALPPGGYVLNVIVDEIPHAFKLRKLYPLKKSE